jgi:hypothetical protein
MRLGRYEALPNTSLGADFWEITEDDASADGGKRKVGVAPNRSRAESDLLRMSARAVLGNECLAIHVNEGPIR